jgi:hypothetical protein
MALWFSVMTSLLSAESLAPTMALWSDTETVVAVIEIAPPCSPDGMDAGAPALLSVEPAIIPGDTVAELVVRGAYLGEGFTMTLWKEAVSLPCLHVRGLDDGRYACTFDLRGVGSGVFNLTVRTASGREASLPACLTVLAGEGPGENMKPPQKGQEGSGGGSGTPGVGNTVPPVPPGGDDGAATPCEPVQESPRDQGEVNEVDDSGPAPGGVGAFRVTPSTVSAALSVDLLIEGGTFSAGMQARLTRGGNVAWSTSCEILTETQMRCRFNLAGITPGTYKLEITDYQGRVIYNVGYVKVVSAT